MSNVEVHFPKEDKPSRIKKWKVSKDSTVTAGRILLLYQDVETGKVEKKLKAPQFGRIINLLVKENEVLHPGQPVLIMEGCKHPTVMKDLCAECGADLREEIATHPEKLVTQANVPMIHSVPELKVTAELAEKIGREDKERLLKHKQLVLLVDLDQTIVHTTNDNIPANLEDVHHFQLYGPNSPWYHTRLRPHTRQFLSEISKLYELHICTFGARQYAHKVAGILDNDGQLFSHRILSRDECFDSMSKTANLKALFPCGVDMVCIIDDRDDVWQGCANLVQVKPYHYFVHTGDINAPPGIGKHDDSSPVNSMAEEEFLRDIKSEIKTEDAVEIKKEIEDEQPEVAGAVEIKIEVVVKEENEGIEYEEGEKKNYKEKDKPKKDVDKRSDYQQLDKDKIKKEHEEPQYNSQEVEDQDDYLLYLEDILKRIHSEFYSDTGTTPRSKSLREIIPKVRLRVLQGLNLTFSGLVPNNQKLHQSRAYKVARAFGAQVSQDLSEQTTHLVAIHPGTVKVREAKKQGKVKIVNPDWLWTCAERWEHVDERLYPLKEVTLHKAREFRKPPAHCSTPEHVEVVEKKDTFADSINPLMTFSKEEIANMDAEVDENMSDLEDELNDDIEEELENDRKRDLDSDSNDVYASYGYDEDMPCNKKQRRDSDDEDSESEKASDDDDEDYDPVTRFRRGEDLPDDLDLGDNSQDSVCDLEVEDMEDEREWNAMGAALEREFLSD